MLPSKATQASPKPPTPNLPTSLGDLWRQDPLARAAVWLFLACNAFYWIPWVQHPLRLVTTRHVAPIVFLGLVIVSLRVSLERLENLNERRFWIDLTVAYTCWLASRLVHLLAPQTTLVSVLEDLLYACFYVAMVMALERRVHRRNEWRPTHLERALTWPGVAVFVAGAVLYFVFIPLRIDAGSYLGGLPSLHFYAGMDIFLTSTCIYLASTSPTARWRQLYVMMSVAVGTTLLSDLSELLGFLSGWQLGSRWDGLWNIPLLAMVWTARLRHVRSTPTEAGHMEVTHLEGNLSGPSGRTMVMGLAFPLFHFAGYASHVLDPRSQAQREILVFWWLLLLAAISIFQHRILQRQILSMAKDRESFEASLRNSEKDLRFMVERRHTDTRLRLSQQKFFKAFHASPDILIITSMDDRTLVEVNDRFEKVLGYRKEEVLGKTADELELWADPDERRAVAKRLKQEGHVRNQEVRFRRRDGDVGRALFSAELIRIDGSASLLSVTRDITELRQIEAQLEIETQRLAKVDASVVVTDMVHRIVYWNRAAEDLYGWLEADVLERDLIELLFGAGAEAARQGADQAAKGSPWNGHLEVRRHNGDLVAVNAWWSRLELPPTGGAHGQLMLVSRAAPTP